LGDRGSKESEREREREHIDFRTVGTQFPLLFCTATLHFRISLAARMREEEAQAARERVKLSLHTCKCACVGVCVGPITMGLWCEFLSIVGVCVQLYTVLYVYSMPLHYVCVWKDFLVCEKDMETRFPFSRPALHSSFSHSFISLAILLHSFPFPFCHFFLAAPERILLQLFTYLAIEKWARIKEPTKERGEVGQVFAQMHVERSYVPGYKDVLAIFYFWRTK